MAAPSPMALINPLVTCISGKLPPTSEVPEWAKDLQKKIDEDPLGPLKDFKPWPKDIPGIPFAFPALNVPGFPAMLMGALESMFAGINYVLEFLPPDPTKLPSPPDVTMFIDAFMASSKDKIPPMPSSSRTIEGVTIDLPEVPGPELPGPPNWFDPAGILKLIVLFIALPFLIIKGIIDYLVENLKVQVPTLDDLKTLIGKIGLALGIPIATMNMFSDCLASIFVSALSVLG